MKEMLIFPPKMLFCIWLVKLVARDIKQPRINKTIGRTKCKLASDWSIKAARDRKQKLINKTIGRTNCKLASDWLVWFEEPIRRKESLP